jgi:hypothetical protein
MSSGDLSLGGSRLDEHTFLLVRCGLSPIPKALSIGQPVRREHFIEHLLVPPLRQSQGFVNGRRLYAGKKDEKKREKVFHGMPN